MDNMSINPKDFTNKDFRFLVDYNENGYVIYDSGNLILTIAIDKSIYTTSKLCELVEILTGEGCNDFAHIMS